MQHALEFRRVHISDFKNFRGDHKVKLNHRAGLYFWTGRNKENPQLGANGVGKSSIFDALFWCFWGKTIKDSRPANAVAPWGSGKTKTQVQVHFKRDGTDHFLYRTRNPNSLRHSEGASDDDKEIQQEDVPAILGMNEETFRRTILIGQFGTMFLDLKPEAQSAMFSEALELERWLLLSKLAAKKASVEEDSARLTADQINRLTGRLEELRQQRETAKEMAAAWDESHAGTVSKLEKALAARQAVLNELTASPVGKPAQAQELADALDRAQKAHGAAVALSRAGERSLVMTEAGVANRVAAIATARKNITKLEDAGKDKECPTCGQKVTGKHLKTELAAAEAVLAQLLKQQEEEKATAKTQTKRNEENDELVRKAQKLAVKCEEKIAEAETTFVQWEANVKVAKRDMHSARQELEATKEAANPYSGTVESTRERIKTVKAELADANETLASEEKQAGQFKYWVNAFKEIRLSLINEVLQELEVSSSEHAARLGLVDWDIKFQTERIKQSGDVSLGFNVELYPPGQKEPVRWESYSGGEDRRWQLAVTFGLSEVLLARAGLTCNLEVLDEPAQHMSAEGVEALLECLSDRAKEQDKTIFYVDHTSLDRGWFDGVFTVQRDREGSKVLS